MAFLFRFVTAYRRNLMVKRKGFCLKWSSLSYISENNIGPTILILGTVEGSSSYFGELQISVIRITDICNSIMNISKRISDIFNSITDICNSLNYGYLLMN